MLDITPLQRNAIQRAIILAASLPVPLEVVVETRVPMPFAGYTTRPSHPVVTQRAHLIDIGNYAVLVAFEVHPEGTVRHISITEGDGGAIPCPLMSAVLCEAFAFSDFPPEMVWVEEYEPGHFALNFAEFSGRSAAGHA